MVTFNEEEHKYENVKTKDVYISATTLIHKYSNPFPKEFMSNYKALELIDPNFKKNKKVYLLNKDVDYLFKVLPSYIDKKLLYKTAQDFIAQWDKTNLDSRIKGTTYHNKREQQAFDSKIATFADVEYSVQDYRDLLKGKTLEELLNIDYYKYLPDDYYPELRLFHHGYKIAGTSDVVLIETDKNGDRWVSIEDFKGFALDTPIATINGWTTIGEIKVGDSIFDGDGNITKVKNVSQIHYNPCYKITFDTNDELVCDHEHRWMIHSLKNSKYVEEELTTDEVFNKFNSEKGLLKINCTSIKTDEINLPIDPYVLGLWLADGNRTCGSITCLNPKCWVEIEKRGYVVGNDISAENRAESRTVMGLYKQLKDNNLLKNKHIPIQYYRASHSQRLDLLRGFMDGDGHFNRTRNRCVMDTTKKWQADAIMQLTSTLGMKPTLLTAKTSGFGKIDVPTWHVCFSPSENPFLCRNEDYLEVMKGVNTVRSQFRHIKSIEKIETVPTKCLEVESDTHTYLAGYSLIKTHNTNKEIKMDNRYQNMLYPLTHYPDSNYHHYTLQISLYAYMLECMGFKIKHLRITWIDEFQNEIPYILEYKRQDVINMINHYINNK